MLAQQGRLKKKKGSSFTKINNVVYLIHFEKKFHHCQHYIGYTADENFEKRISCHKKGVGSRLLRAVNLAGIAWEVVMTWPDKDGNFERSLKKRRNAAKLCPKCFDAKRKDDNEKNKKRYANKKQLLIETNGKLLEPHDVSVGAV